MKNVASKSNLALAVLQKYGHTKSIFLNLQHYPRIESMPSKSTAMNARISDSNGEIAKLFFHKRCLQPGSSIMGSVDFSSASRICCQFLVSLISKGELISKRYFHFGPILKSQSSTFKPKVKKMIVIWHNYLRISRSRKYFLRLTHL